MVDLNLALMNEEEKFALLFGVMLGDGCLSHYFSKTGKEYFAISITGNYYDDKPFYGAVLIPLLSSLRGKPVKMRERPDGGRIDINFCDRVLFNKIKNLEFPVGKKGTSLVIPEHFCEKNLMKYIVQGFFATDGSLVLTKNPNKFYPRLESQAICKDVLMQICDFLNSLGMKGYFYLSKSKPDPRWKIVQTKYKFQFNGKQNLILFDNLIGFVNPKHKKRFFDFMKYSEEYDKKIKGVAPFKQKLIREVVNSNFFSGCGGN